MMKQQNSPIRFAVVFIVLFVVFYYFNLFFFRAINPGPHYIGLFAHHLNYIKGLRWSLLYGTSFLLRLFGFSPIFNDHELLVAGHGTIIVVYTCLGLGVLSFYTAFIIAFSKPLRSKFLALLVGVIGIEFLNIIRFMLLALYGNSKVIDHHTLFNIIIYVIICVGLYFWIRKDIAAKNVNE